MNFISAIRPILHIEKSFQSSSHFRRSPFSLDLFHPFIDKQERLTVLTGRKLGTISNSQFVRYSSSLSNTCNLAKSTFIDLCKQPIPIGIRSMAHAEVKRLCSLLNVSLSEGTLYEHWEILKEVLAKRKIHQLPMLDPSVVSDSYADCELLRNLFSIYPRPLLKGSDSYYDYQLQDFVYTATENRWHLAPLLFPFPNDPTLLETAPLRVNHVLKQMGNFNEFSPLNEAKLQVDQGMMDQILASVEADAIAAYFLTIPHLHQNVVMHDVGCANGRNLLNLLFYAHLKDVDGIEGCVGTDINHSFLNAAETATILLNFPREHVQFHCSNALDSLHIPMLGFQSDVLIKLALRLIPVLSLKSAKQFLESTHQEIKHPGSVCILSYALPKGNNWDNSLAFEKEGRVVANAFESGVTTFIERFPKDIDSSFLSEDKDVILNTYYSQEAFRRIAAECGLQVIRSVTVTDYTDNNREIVVLKAS